MRGTSFRSVVFAFVLSSTQFTPLFPAAAGEGEPSPKWGPSVDFEGKVGNRRKIGEADLFLPFTQNDRTLGFVSIRGRMDDNTSKEGNYGLGVRHMLPHGWNLGGYGYFDRRLSENNVFFNQVTLGVEALGSDFDLRANAYRPIGEHVQTLSGSGASGGTSTIELSGTNVIFRGGGGGSEEIALRGFDAEVGWRVPIFDVNAPFDFRLYGGGFRFDDHRVSAVAGPRARAEFVAYEVPNLWPGAQVTFGAEWQRDDTRGSQEFLSLRLRIPLQPETKRSRVLTKQELRMTEKIVRDIDIVAKVNTTEGSAAEEIATTADGQTLVVLTPTNTTDANLPTAVANAGANSTVVISGTFSPTAATTLNSNQTLFGGGSIAVKSPSGRTGTFTTASGTISTGNGFSYVVDMANDSTVSDMTFIHADTTGTWSSTYVLRANVNNATISNNSITGSSSGVALGVQGIFAQNATNLSVTDNTFNMSGTNWGGGAGGMSVSNSTVTISNNTFNSNTDGAGAGALGASVVGSVSATISNNTFNSTATGGGPTITTELSGATFTAGSTGNVIVSGTCSNGGGNTGSVSFTDNSTCP